MGVGGGGHMEGNPKKLGREMHGHGKGEDSLFTAETFLCNFIFCYF